MLILSTYTTEVLVGEFRNGNKFTVPELQSIQEVLQHMKSIRLVLKNYSERNPGTEATDPVRKELKEYADALQQVSAMMAVLQIIPQIEPMRKT